MSWGEEQQKEIETIRERKRCKNLLIRLAVKRSKGSILYNISK